MNHEQAVRKLDGDDFELESSVIDTDEHQAIIKVVRGAWDDYGIPGILQRCQSTPFADAVLSGRLSKPNLLHEPFCATE